MKQVYSIAILPLKIKYLISNKYSLKIPIWVLIINTVPKLGANSLILAPKAPIISYFEIYLSSNDFLLRLV
jgi:hypothetical protein